MSTQHHIHQLLSAITVLKELPVMKLAQNGQLMQEISAIVSGRNISSIIDSMAADYRLEKDAAFNQQKKTPKFGPDSPEFLRLYAQYKGAAHNILGENATAAFTQPVGMRDAVACNAGKTNPMAAKEITETKEAKRFEETYNSIFSDHALQIRTPQDPTTIGSFIDYSPYIWNYKDYLAIPTLAQTIDLSIQIATRQAPKITFDSGDEELTELLEKVLKRGRNSEKYQKFLLYSHLSPRGALMVPILDDDGTLRFNIFNDTQFTYATSYQYSRIDFRENQTGVSSLYVLGHLLQNEVTAHFLCPGFEPLYAIGKNRIVQLKDAAEAINIYLYTIKVLCIRAQVIVETWGGEGGNDTMLANLRKQIDDINSELSLNTAQQVPEGAKLEILNNNLSEGFSKVSTIIKEYQGLLSGMMPDYLYGSNTAYSANTFNIHATHQNIRSGIQEPQIEPALRFQINKYLELDKRFDKWRDQVDKFDIEFESLYEPTEVEKTDVAAKKIANIVTMGGYPELAKLFKAEGVLDEEQEIPAITRPEPPANDEEGDEPREPMTALNASEFHESDHPRDGSGKFGSGGGNKKIKKVSPDKLSEYQKNGVPEGVLLHGSEKPIKELSTGFSDTGDIYLTTEPSIAQNYGNNIYEMSINGDIADFSDPDDKLLDIILENSGSLDWIDDSVRDDFDSGDKDSARLWLQKALAETDYNESPMSDINLQNILGEYGGYVGTKDGQSTTTVIWDGDSIISAKNASLVQTIDPKTIQPLHEVRYEPKMMRLVKRMDEDGWKGEPLLVVERAMGTYRAITGTHRIQAAEIQGILVPVVVLPSVEIVNSLTTGKDKRRLQIVESKEFEEAVGRPELVELAREIMRAEVKHNEEGW